MEWELEWELECVIMSWCNDPIAYRQMEARNAELDRIGERGPQVHVPHDPRFKRIYDGAGSVLLVHVESGRCSRWFQMYYEIEAELGWMAERKAETRGVRS